MIRIKVRKIVGLSFIIVALLMSPAHSTAKTLVIKLATLAPEGSAWIKAFHDIDAEVREKTENQVSFKFYPGGILGGDEKDMLRKIYIGQINGAALTSAGLSAIYSEMDVFQIPFLFKSYH